MKSPLRRCRARTGRDSIFETGGVGVMSEPDSWEMDEPLDVKKGNTAESRDDFRKVVK